MTNLLQDLRFAVRQMHRSPDFALTAILNSGARNRLQRHCLRSARRPGAAPDVPHADRVMTLARTNQIYPILSFSEVRDVREGNTGFSAVATWTVENFGLEVNGATRPVWGCEVVGNISRWLACSRLSDTYCHAPRRFIPEPRRRP